uniref:Uncharacterized protein n=1 Tax=Anguilla anguilla TaxID=7936 RepID=A0A0E9XMB6_ANGAN
MMKWLLDKSCEKFSLEGNQVWWRVHSSQSAGMLSEGWYVLVYSYGTNTVVNQELFCALVPWCTWPPHRSSKLENIRLKK